MLKLILWGVANPLEFGAIFASAIAIVRGIYAVITRLVAPYPRLRAVVEGFAALGPDVLRFALQLARAITGRALPSPALDSRDAELAALRAEVRRLKAGDEVVIGRPTVTPPAPIEVYDATKTQRGSVDLATVAAIVTGSLGVLCAGIALAAWSQGCTATRRFVLDHTDGVPARVQCTPRTQVCVLTDAGVYLPSVYSDECRPWPTMPLRPNGTQRTCAAGEGCVVEADGGLAHCTAADGGR